MLDYLEYQTKKQKIIVRRKQTCFYVGIVDSKNEDSMNMTIIDEQQSDALENRWESFELSKVAKKKNKTFKTWKITWISEQEQYVICDLPKDSEQYQLLIEWLDEVAPTAKLIQPKRLDGIKMVFTYDFLANKQWKTYQETLTITRKERKVRLEQSDSEYWDYDREETIRNASLVHEILDKCQKVSLKKLPNYVMKDHTVPNLSIQLQYHDQTKKEVVRSYCEKGVTDEIAQFVNLVEQGLQGLNTGMLMWIDDGELVSEYIYYCQVSFGKDEPLCACHSLDEEIHVGDVVMVSDSKSFDMKQGLVMKVEVFEEDDFPEEYMDTPFILDKVEEHFQTITPIFEEDLKDNKSLEDAIHQLYQQESEENFEVVFQCLSKLLHSHFIIPVMQQVVEDESYLIKRIEGSEKKDSLIPIFTSINEVEQGEPTAYISDEMIGIFDYISKKDDLEGIVINPWTESFFIPKEFIPDILKEYSTTINQIHIQQGDITELECECIVNAANQSLMGGSGVDGAIHRAAGPQLLKECANLHGCKPGEAKITPGYDLAANYIIHTVGPIYFGTQEDEETLSACYWNSLELAKEHQIHSIAFPAISTGVYGYPLEEAVAIAVDTVEKWFYENEEYGMEVIFCCYDQKTYDAYWNYVSLSWEETYGNSTYS